jgi:threonine/homoserine/homoserine lactone efflux protein
MHDLHFWILFLSAAALLNISPGPDLLYVLTQTASGGKKIGFASSLGVCTGALFHVCAAAVGLSAILVSSVVAFSIVKYIGAAYLFYLALQSFKSTGFELKAKKTRQPETSALQAFKQGILIDILNPKAAIFFMAFLPQFIREDAGAVPFQLFYLGVIVITVGIVVEAIYVLASDQLLRKLRNNTKFSIWLNRSVGAVFAGLGIKLVVATH